MTGLRRSFVVRKSSSINPKNSTYILNHSDGKEAKVAMQQTATDVDQVKVATQQTAIDIDQVKRLSFSLITADHGALRIISEKQLRESVHKWLSPPDPSTNHNIACSTHHKKTASWFFEGSIFREWKSTGSLLWIHGKRLSCPLSVISL